MSIRIGIAAQFLFGIKFSKLIAYIIRPDMKDPKPDKISAAKIMDIHLGCIYLELTIYNREVFKDGKKKPNLRVVKDQ